MRNSSVVIALMVTLFWPAESHACMRAWVETLEAVTERHIDRCSRVRAGVEVHHILCDLSPSRIVSLRREWATRYRYLVNHVGLEMTMMFAPSCKEYSNNRIEEVKNGLVGDRSCIRYVRPLANELVSVSIRRVLEQCRLTCPPTSFWSSEAARSIPSASPGGQTGSGFAIPRTFMQELSRRCPH